MNRKSVVKDQVVFIFVLWNNLAKEFQAAEIDTIILACTDLNVVLNRVHSSFKIIDSSRALAEAIVKKWQSID